MKYWTFLTVITQAPLIESISLINDGMLATAGPTGYKLNSIQQLQKSTPLPFEFRETLPCINFHETPNSMHCEKMHRFRLSTGERERNGETETERRRERQRDTHTETQRENERTNFFINEGVGISTIPFYIQPSGERERRGEGERAVWGKRGRQRQADRQTGRDRHINMQANSASSFSLLKIHAGLGVPDWDYRIS